jgi:hypothetical protein
MTNDQFDEGLWVQIEPSACAQVKGSVTARGQIASAKRGYMCVGPCLALEVGIA